MATTIDLGAAEKKAPFGNLHVLVMCGLGRDVITGNQGRLKLYLHVTLRPEGVQLCLCVLRFSAQSVTVRVSDAVALIYPSACRVLCFLFLVYLRADK